MRTVPLAADQHYSLVFKYTESHPVVTPARDTPSLEFESNTTSDP
jgi:hypothetical protein